MSYRNPDLEDALEQETISLFQSLGWETVNAYEETLGNPQEATVRRPYLGREHQGEVILRPRLRTALQHLNPDVPAEAITHAIEELGRFSRAGCRLLGPIKKSIAC